jgi:phosphomannomutase/phosphoglucomutase
MDINQDIFKMYDIRGEVPKDINSEVVNLIGKAYSIYIKKRIGKDDITISVGRDVRLHSEMLSKALIEGIRDYGINVIDIGICPTPTLYFSLFNLPIDGGIMITASHNPPEFNGMKLCVGKETLYGEEIQELYSLTKEAENTGNTVHYNKGKLDTFDILPLYRKYLLDNFKNGVLKEVTPKSIRIATDCGNGCAGLIVPSLLKELGIDLIELYSNPDGRFPNHHPDPTVIESLEKLIETVREKRLDFGIAYDGDVDRIGVIDNNGEIVYGDKLTYVFAKDILREHPGAKIISEVKSSKTLFDGIEKLGGVPIMSAVGHSLIKKKLREENALFAGEMSGHMFFNDRYFGYDDAIYATLRLIEIVAKEKLIKNNFIFSDLLKDLPKVYVSPEIRVDCLEEKKFQIVEHFLEMFKAKYPNLSKEIKKVITIDGIRIEFPDGWGLLRASNTQPAVVMRFEAETEDRLELYKKSFEDTILSL